MNPVLDEMLTTGLAIAEDGKQQRVSSHIPVEEGLFLQQMISEAKPETSLEIGLAYGVSALFMCETLASLPNVRRHIVVDPHQFEPSDILKTHATFQGIGLYNLKKAGYERLIEFRNEPSERALPKLLSEGVQVDFAFIDGWHTFDFVLVDFFYVDRLLRPGGIVVLDDTDFPSIWKLCHYIVTNRAYKVVQCLRAPEPQRRNPLPQLARSAKRVLSGSTRRDGLLPHSRCIAFRKEADDSRSWDFHRDF